LHTFAHCAFKIFTRSRPGAGGRAFIFFVVFIFFVIFIFSVASIVFVAIAHVAIQEELQSSVFSIARQSQGSPHNIRFESHKEDLPGVIDSGCGGRGRSGIVNFAAQKKFNSLFFIPACARKRKLHHSGFEAHGVDHMARGQPSSCGFNGVCKQPIQSATDVSTGRGQCAGASCFGKT
jgi:hypothetical protein